MGIPGLGQVSPSGQHSLLHISAQQQRLPGTPRTNQETGATSAVQGYNDGTGKGKHINVNV